MTHLGVADRFGRNLWRSRRLAGLSQQRLGDLTEIHRTEISLLERGLRLPRLDTIIKVAAGVEHSPCVLLSDLRWQPGYYVEGVFVVEGGLNRGSRKWSLPEITREDQR